MMLGLYRAWYLIFLETNIANFASAALEQS